MEDETEQYRNKSCKLQKGTGFYSGVMEKPLAGLKQRSDMI